MLESHLDQLKTLSPVTLNIADLPRGVDN